MWKWFSRFSATALANWITYRPPKFDPSLWGEANDTQYNNNCYNYACDVHGTYAQPGLSVDYQYKKICCDQLHRAALADGLIPIGDNKRCSRGCHKVALAISPGESFHWYRQDSDGYWSHKPGDGPPTNFDYSGTLISDPKKADRGPFTIFCGSYCVCRNRVSIK
jgi:hypothetical protein